jgi:hypothetical protein
VPLASPVPPVLASWSPKAVPLSFRILRPRVTGGVPGHTSGRLSQISESASPFRQWTFLNCWSMSERERQARVKRFGCYLDETSGVLLGNGIHFAVAGAAAEPWHLGLELGGQYGTIPTTTPASSFNLAAPVGQPALQRSAGRRRQERRTLTTT